MASFRQNKEGNWYFIIDAGYDILGKRKQKTVSKDDRGHPFVHEHQARTYAERLKKQIDKGRKLDSVRLKDTITEYFDHVVSEEVSDITYENQWRITQKHIIPHIGNLFLDKVTDDHLDNFFKKMLRSASDKDNDLRATIYQIGLVLSKFFKYCVKKRRISDNPMSLVTRPAYVPELKTVWTTEQIHDFLELTKNSKFRIAYILGEATGMRRGEMLALQWTDVDFERSTIVVNKALKYTKKKGLHISFTKTQNSRRTITVPSYAMEALRAHKEASLPDAVLVFDNFGNYYSPGLLSDNFNRDNKRSGLPMTTIHGLRHYHATNLLSNGFSVADVAARLGDKKETIMKVYAHAVPNKQTEIAAYLDRLNAVDKRDL